MNTIYHQDCIIGMRELADESVDCILTDPPYKYLKNQKLEVDFDEAAFFTQAKRVLKKNGFIVLFGRGTSFYRWNTMLADMGFTFKEEIVWDKSYCTSPLMAVGRVHETISIYTKGKGVINRVKVPYLEMKEHDVGSIVQDIKRMKAILNNTKSLDAVLTYLGNNTPKFEIAPSVKHKGTIRGAHYGIDRSAAVVNAITRGMKEKTIIRTDHNERTEHKYRASTKGTLSDGDRSVNVLHSMTQGMNEKTIIKQAREHYSTIHPTQKPVRLLERLLALVTKEGDLVLDPFSGSGATAIACTNTNRRYIGYEIDQEYHQLSVQRIEQHTQQSAM